MNPVLTDEQLKEIMTKQRESGLPEGVGAQVLKGGTKPKVTLVSKEFAGAPFNKADQLPQGIKHKVIESNKEHK